MRKTSVPLILLVSFFMVSSLPAQTGRLFLKAQDGYSELQKLQIQLACLKIEIQEKDRLKEFQFHQLAQEINRAINRATPGPEAHVDLSSLEVFNYTLAGISPEEERQRIVVSILADRKFVEQKSEVEQKRFLSDCFRLISQKLSKNFVDFDEYRDLAVKFYPLDYEAEPFVEYREGGYIWAPRKR